jgi:predicted nucleic acid-binding protein
MITAIDTNILFDILLPNKRFYESSVKAFEDSATLGVLVICDVVYAELCMHFASQQECDGFLEKNDVQVEALTREAHFLASRSCRSYRMQGGQRDRILPDFLIGAHAQIQASRLLSRDRGFYRKLFPSLRVVDPSSELN